MKNSDVMIGALPSLGITRTGSVLSASGPVISSAAMAEYSGVRASRAPNRE
ncbi:hypothetical protein D3C72_2186940 [compost metagenome]